MTDRHSVPSQRQAVTRAAGALALPGSAFRVVAAPVARPILWWEPAAQPWFWATVLVLLWGSVLWGLVRRGRRAFRPGWVVSVLGYSLLAARHLVAGLEHPAWVIGAGVVMGCGLLWPRPWSAEPTESGPPQAGPDRA